MKTFATWFVLLWLALVLENTRADLFPACSLTIPLAVGCILWMRSGWAIQLAGFTLIGRWLLQPSVIPVEIAVVVLASAWMVAKGQKNQWNVSPTKIENATHWGWPIAVVVLGIANHTTITSDFAADVIVGRCISTFAVAIPVMVVVLICAKAADEFGIRTATSR